MPVVPITKGKPLRPSVPPPESTFALMAAAVMHSEGRLIAPGSSAKTDSTQPQGLLNAQPVAG